MYVITNGKVYVGIDKDNTQTTVASIKKAKIFDSQKTAKNFLGCLKHTLRRFSWRIEEIEDSTETLYDEIQKINVDELSCDDELKKIVKCVATLEGGFEDLKMKQLEYNKQLSQLDAEICDIEHAAEFYTLNAVQGYKLYKSLHNAMVKRRMVKDSLLIIQILFEKGLNKNSRDVIKSLKGLDKRQYEPRIRKDLFTEGV